MKDSVSVPFSARFMLILARAVRPVQVETKYPLDCADRLLLSVGVSAKIRRIRLPSVSHEYAAACTACRGEDNQIDVRLAQSVLAVSGIEYDVYATRCRRGGTSPVAFKH
jgi:hypothetical protein